MAGICSTVGTRAKVMPDTTVETTANEITFEKMVNFKN